jgi:NitT/TauT family transport system substrate-binding protein
LALPPNVSSAWTRRQALAASLGVAGGLVGCQAPVPPLRVGSIIFPGYELLFLARELGLLPPDRLRLVEMNNNTDTLRALALGRLEAAALTLDEVIRGRDQGLDLRIVLVLDESAGADVVMVAPHIRSLAGLKGRRIGFEEGATGAVMMGALLATAGLEVHQVVKVRIPLAASVDAFYQQSLDAVVTIEPWATQLEARGARRVFDSSQTPGLIVDVLAVRAEVLDRSRDALRALVTGHFEALRRFRASPASQAVALAPRLRLDPADVPAAFKGLDLPDAEANRRWLAPQGLLSQSAERLGGMLHSEGLIRSAASLVQLGDPSCLPAP